jgi:hypothetical protein
MADDANIITLPKRPKTPAERARAYRARKKAGLPAVVSPPARTPITLAPVPAPTVTPVTLHVMSAASRRPASSYALILAAIALAVVGMMINGWFARSLGSTDAAGWLFLAIGLAADLVALAAPSCAYRLWQDRRKGTALAGWAAWVMTFNFAVTAGIGFASVNIADVTTSRASRATPAVTAAQLALGDSLAARDRECRGGVGKFCREREAEVVARRQALDAVMGTIAQAADPQTDAAIKLVSWVTHGVIRPAADDFAMLRLCLLALLPQIGGVLLMVARGGRHG